MGIYNKQVKCEVCGRSTRSDNLKRHNKSCVCKPQLIPSEAPKRKMEVQIEENMSQPKQTKRDIEEEGDGNTIPETNNRNDYIIPIEDGGIYNESPVNDKTKELYNNETDNGNGNVVYEWDAERDGQPLDFVFSDDETTEDGNPLSSCQEV